MAIAPHDALRGFQLTQTAGFTLLAFMMGMERNGDTFGMSSYAPLLERATWDYWNPNAIQYNSSRIYATPSYYVQAMFGANRADVSLPTSVEAVVRNPEPIMGKSHGHLGDANGV